MNPNARAEHKILRQIPPDEIGSLHSGLRDVIDYRKSGLSLNHVIGCPLNCAYCVRHFFDNFSMKQPQMLMSDEAAVAELVSHRFFVPHKTPLQIFNRATDPFLPGVRLHTHRVLQLLDAAALTNLTLVITRYEVSSEDMNLLESLKNLRITLLFTYSGLNGTDIEPLLPSITLGSIDLSARHKKRVKTVLYWRPIVPGWNDSEQIVDHVLDVSQKTDAIAYTGLFYRAEQKAHFGKIGLVPPYQGTHRRKVLPGDVEDKILQRYRASGIRTPIFRKTSCAVAHVHATSDYNGHYGIRDICDICPQFQIDRCAAAHPALTRSEFQAILDQYGYQTPFEIGDGHVWTSNLGEERRYHLQHALGFQVWDRDWPHLPGQHGRAPEGHSRLVTLRPANLDSHSS
jgi:DNA repair photolyase